MNNYVFDGSTFIETVKKRLPVNRNAALLRHQNTCLIHHLLRHIGSIRYSTRKPPLIPKLGNLDSWCPTLCGDGRIVNASRIKCLDGRDKPAATPHMGREQRELVLAALRVSCLKTCFIHIINSRGPNSSTNLPKI